MADPLFWAEVGPALDAIWVSDGEGFIFRIDPITRELTRLEMGGPISALAVDEEIKSIWVLV